MPSAEAKLSDGASSVEGRLSPTVNPDLLSSICHDLKAPLASIVMGAGFLRKVVSPENAAALRVVDAIGRASERMGQLIVSFSDLAKLEMHDLTLQLRPYNMDAIVRTAVEQFTPEATAQGVTVSLEVGAGVATNERPCDRERVLQIFRHLTTCALRVVPENGSVSISVGRDALGVIRFEIEGKPPGGPRARRIATEPSKPDLAIASGLVELHGGRLVVACGEDSLMLTFTLQAPSDVR